MPKFSVIVPVYQAEKYLEKAIRSVLEQTFTDWELILVDDGCTDRSPEICNNFADFDSRIIVIHQENQGVSAARNAGMRMATGQFIAFLDSDDYFMADMLERMNGALEDEDTDSVACSHMNIYPDGREVYESFGIAPDTYLYDGITDAIVRPLLRDRVEGERPLNGYVWRCCYKREIIVENGITFTGAFLEDELFLIEFFSIANRMVVLKDALYAYCPNENSVTKKYLPTFVNTFVNSYQIKQDLVAKYSITGIDGWEYNTLWAGLLTAVGNIYAPGNKVSVKEKRKTVAELVNSAPFAAAVRRFNPKKVTGNKRIVVRLIRLRAFGLLSLLYYFKNRKR